MAFLDYWAFWFLWQHRLRFVFDFFLRLFNIRYWHQSFFLQTHILCFFAFIYHSSFFTFLVFYFSSKRKINVSKIRKYFDNYNFIVLRTHWYRKNFRIYISVQNNRFQTAFHLRLWPNLFRGRPLIFRLFCSTAFDDNLRSRNTTIYIFPNEILLCSKSSFQTRRCKKAKICLYW